MVVVDSLLACPSEVHEQAVLAKDEGWRCYPVDPEADDHDRAENRDEQECIDQNAFRRAHRPGIEHLRVDVLQLLV